MFLKSKFNILTMKVTIQNVNGSLLTTELKGLIIKKVHKLTTYARELQDADVSLIEISDKEKRDKGIECKLYLPGHTLFAKSFETSFEKAIDSVTESLRRQIHKVKAKKGY